MTKGYYTILTDRAGIMASGEEARDFLQSLVTQDLGLPDSQKVIYSALLTPQGKMDYDFFIWEQADALMIECEAARAEALLKRLSMFRLRKKVELVLKPIQVVAAWDVAEEHDMFQLIHDPRKKLNLYRKIVEQDFDFNQLNDLQKTESKFYYELCILNAIPSGSFDIAWGDDTVADIGLAHFGGVSFEKGCYMGQELTSRMHHRNLGKKGLYRVRMDGPALPPFSDITVDGRVIGQMRSSVGGNGLAMLRHDSTAQAAEIGLHVVQPV